MQESEGEEGNEGESEGVEGQVEAQEGLEGVGVEALLGLVAAMGRGDGGPNMEEKSCTDDCGGRPLPSSGGGKEAGRPSA
jgi:hypothetical protein